jgi:hypothetical protein
LNLKLFYRVSGQFKYFFSASFEPAVELSLVGQLDAFSRPFHIREIGSSQDDLDILHNTLLVHDATEPAKASSLPVNRPVARPEISCFVIGRYEDALISLLWRALLSKGVSRLMTIV